MIDKVLYVLYSRLRKHAVGQMIGDYRFRRWWKHAEKQRERQERQRENLESVLGFMRQYVAQHERD